MKIALVTLQGNPFGQTPEAGPDRQDRRLASLVSALAGQDHDVPVYARRDSETQPQKSEPAPGVTVEHVPAGPAKELPADSLAPHAAEFGQYIARHWQESAPDVAHAYFWNSGVGATDRRPGPRPGAPAGPVPGPRRRPGRSPAPPGAGHRPQRARGTRQLLQRDVYARPPGRAPRLGTAHPARRGHRDVQPRGPGR